MSGEMYDKQPGFPETVQMLSHNRIKFYQTLQQCQKISWIGITDQWLTVTSTRQILLSKSLNCRSDTFKNFSPLFSCLSNLLLEMVIN
jgi:hypothetical protein